MGKLLEKLHRREPVLGTHVTLNDSSITELIGNIGFDFLWIDTEHSPIDLNCLQQHLIAARAAGVSAIVRVPSNDAVRVKPVLEMGPDGIVFPQITSYEEALRAVQACMYPPKGVRGYGPRRAIQYGRIPVGHYLTAVDTELLKFIQIEHIDAVRDLDRILTIREIDAFILGPCDLASSMGKIGKWNDPEVVDAIAVLFEKVKAAGKPMGVSFGATTFEDIVSWKKRGADMISIAADTDLLRLGATEVLSQLRKAYGLAADLT
jgi:2-keto-3-deoxy-L-rhamnonate aldolase RhmA